MIDDNTSTRLAEFFGRHKRVALQLSAGKDSGACLKLVRPWIDQVLVIWANPGRPYPETVSYMRLIRASVPHFKEVIGLQPEFVAAYGYPADAVPFEATELGRIVAWDGHSTQPRLVHITQCCGINLWLPLHKAVRDSDCTGVIKGERQADVWRSTAEHEVEGREYLRPVWGWTDQEVVDFLGDDLPPSYKRGLQSSLDCMTCTAYLRHNRGRLHELRQRHPDEWREVEPVLRYQRLLAMQHLNNLMHEYPMGTEDGPMENPPH